MTSGGRINFSEDHFHFLDEMQFALPLTWFTLLQWGSDDHTGIDLNVNVRIRLLEFLRLAFIDRVLFCSRVVKELVGIQI